MGQLAQCTRDIPVNAQRTASKPLFEDLSPGPAVGYNRNESILVQCALQVGVPSNAPACLLRNPGTPQILLSFMLRQKQESQHAQHGESERGFLAVPGRRLPHEEILSTDTLKPRQPQ